MRIKSLVKAQLIEMKRNPSIVMMPIVVLVLVMIWATIDEGAPGGFFPAASLIFTAYMVALQIPVLSLSEEKEKRTLEAVLLTPASPAEVIGAKIIVSAAVSLLTGVISLVIYQQAPANLLLFLVGFGLALVLTISLGVLIGLIAKDQKSAGVISAAVMMFLAFGTVMPWEHTMPALWSVMRWLPTRPLLELLLEAMTGLAAEIPAWRSVLVMLPYVALALFISVRQVRRQASAR